MLNFWRCLSWFMCALALPVTAQDATPKVIETRYQQLTREEFNDLDLFIRTISRLDMEWFRSFNDNSHVYKRPDGVRVYIMGWNKNSREELSREDSPFRYVNYYDPEGHLVSKHIEFHREENYGRCWYIFKDNKLIEERPAPYGFNRFNRPIKEIRAIFFKETGADMFDKSRVPLVIRSTTSDSIPVYEIFALKYPSESGRREGTGYLVHGETGEVLFHVENHYEPRIKYGIVNRGILVENESDTAIQIKSLLDTKINNKAPLYAIFRKEYGDDKFRFYDVFTVKKGPDHSLSVTIGPILWNYFVDLKKSEITQRADAMGFSASSSILEEYEAYRKILDVEKKEKKVSWLLTGCSIGQSERSRKC